MNIIINDINLYYEKYGTGEKSILILPGWGNTRLTFNRMIEQLKKKYTVYIIDYPGFGNSTFPNRDLFMDDYAKLIRDFINIVGITSPHIISHSFGTRIAIILSVKLKVDIDKLIIIDGAGIKKRKTIRQYLKQLSYKFLKKLQVFLPLKKRKRYVNKLIKIYGSSDYKSLNENMRRTFSNIVNEDLTKYLKEIKQDTLIIWGENDIDTPLKDGIMMNKEIKGSGLIVIKKATHFSYLENCFYVNRILNEFLKD